MIYFPVLFVNPEMEFQLGLGTVHWDTKQQRTMELR